jgi:hypothetical protein
MEEAKDFVQAAQLQIKNAIYPTSNHDFKTPKKSYYWGLLGLIPLVGAVNGLIMVISGISKYRDVKYVIIGCTGIVITLVTYGALLYHINGNFTDPANIFRSQFIDISQNEQNSLIKEIEFYKLQYGAYPDSLQQLKDKSFTNIYDPVLGNSRIFNYHKMGNKYTLFSSGVDEIPNTADDIYPSLSIDTNKIGLIIRRK